MMSVRVKVFASLREQLGVAEMTLNAAPVLSAAQVWAALSPNSPPPDNLLIAINQHYASLDSAVADGDEVAFFPPVTGG
jgi:sulfur-carrier protein